MPERSAPVNYQGFDPESQRLTTPSLNIGDDFLHEEAKPQTEVGEALQKTGGQLAEVGNKATDVAAYQAGLANETAANDASNDFDSKVGSLYGKYATLTGSQAVAAAPQIKAQILALQQQAIQGMSPAATRATNLLTHRIVAQRLIDVDTYAAQQQKQAFRASGLSLVNVAAQIDEPTALDDNRFGQRIGDIKHGVGMQMQDDLAPHVGDNGQINDGTPEGKAAKDAYQQNVDNAVGQAWSNRFAVLSLAPNYGPVNAWQKFQDEKENVPPMASAHIQAFLEPAVYEAHVNQAFSNGYNDVQRSYADHLTNPPAQTDNLADAIHKYGEGGALTSTTSVNGAVGGWQIEPGTFQQYAKPGENINDPKDNEAVGRRIVADYEKKWPDDPARVAVAYFSGPGNVAPPGSATPWIQDKQDGNGTSVSQYVNKVTNGLGQNKQSKPYATNPDGTMMSQADYLIAHQPEVLQKWADWADKQMPGDLEFRNQVVERARQQIDDLEKAQGARYRQDNAFVIKAINGDMTNGKPPATFMELQAIPGVKDVLNRVEAQDPKFSQGIDGMIARVNKGGDKDIGTYGSGYRNILQDIWDGKITDLKPLQDAVSKGDLTMSGYEKMKAQLPGGSSDPIQKSNENELNKNTFNAVHSLVTHGLSKEIVEANPAMQKTISAVDIALFAAIDDRQKRGISPSQYYDPNNKEYIGNDAKVFQITHAAAIAAQIRANQASAHPITLPDIIQKAKNTKDPAEQAKLRQQAIDLGFYDPNAPSVPVAK